MLHRLLDHGRYPIDRVADQVNAALHANGTCVVVAPPGIGKTTRLPLLLEGSSERIVVTQPRRAAAFAAAQRMAATLGERVGERVGLRMRDDTRVGAATQIEVVTEGVFIKMLRADPFLSGIGTILFDEVHERSLDSDLSIALCVYAREVVRPDLRLVAMSATLEAEATAQLLGAPVIRTDTPLFDVAVWYEPTLLAEFTNGASRNIGRLLDASDGDILAFLPGSREIRAVIRQFDRRPPPKGVIVCALLGSSSPAEMNLALAPAPSGSRKVVLATSIAQTSITIPGVRSIIDSGLTRRSTFDPRTGISRLLTERSSKATAIQRAGRAGREAPGQVIRLWSKSEFEQSPNADVPEILDCDLSETVLTLACWGITSPSELRWMDSPLEDSWTTAHEAVRSLGLLDKDGAVTALGEAVRHLPAHPRIQVMLSFVRQHGDASSRKRASDLATDLSGSESLRRTFISFLEDGTDAQSPRSLSTGLLGALAFPDRIAARIGGDPGRYQLVGSPIASLDSQDPLRGSPFLVALELDADRKSGKIFRAETLTLDEVRSVLTDCEIRRAAGLTESGNVEAFEERRYGAITVERRRVDPTPKDIAMATLDAFDFGQAFTHDDVQRIVARVEFVRSLEPDLQWPDWSLERLAADETQRQLLLPIFERLPAKRPLDHVQLATILLESLSLDLYRELDRLAPRTISLPSGRTLRVDYLGDATPTVRSRLQDFFGLREGPRIGRGRVALRIELLSPAGRTTAVTSDLSGFWSGGYKAVRADLRHRYPKHSWPEDPSSHAHRRST